MNHPENTQRAAASIGELLIRLASLGETEFYEAPYIAGFKLYGDKTGTLIRLDLRLVDKKVVP